MSVTAPSERAVTGRVDREGRLIAADPPLAALNARAGGAAGGMLSVPQIAALARLSHRLGITISRGAIAADGDRDIDLWVRADPVEDGVELSITGWNAHEPRPPAPAPAVEREADFLRAAADWSWECDDTMRITALSAAASAAIGRGATDLIGRQLTRLFRFREGDEGQLPILNALAEHRRFEDQIAELRNGRKGRFLLSGVPLIDGTGRFAGFSGVATSLSSQGAGPSGRAASGTRDPGSSAFGERLDQALRVPLAHIVESAERLRSQTEGPLQRDYAGYADDIASAGRHLMALVDDLVDLQAIERPGFAPDVDTLDLADLARRAAGLLAVRAADRSVRIDAPRGDETLMARGDFTRVLQILMNLITNAIRYSPEGGEVWIRLEREADLAALVVADMGKGIAEEDQDRIFDKFERVDPSEPGGTGLGLYIARRLARVMGGDLAVDSAPGQGARFTLTLPLAEG
jgi:signal transduction histidine kinase